MRHIALILLAAVFLAAGCHKKPAQDPSARLPEPKSPTTLVSQGNPGRLTLVCSYSENDPWSNEIAAAAGGLLGFDAFSKRGQSGHLDVFGPYDGSLGKTKLQVQILMCGLGGSGQIEQQRAITQEAFLWLQRENPGYVWLDGDPVQFNLGRRMGMKRCVLISGGMQQRDTYFDTAQSVTGCYRRPSFERILRQITEANPKAKVIRLINDSSIQSMGQVADLRALEPALPKGMSFMNGTPVEDWAAVRSALKQPGADACLLCSLGGDRGPSAILDQPCPADLLKGVKPAVVVLGPSRADNCGAIVLSIKPSAHAKDALDCLGKAIADPANLPPISTPADMAAFMKSGA
jgi:hypothetical protein